MTIRQYLMRRCNRSLTGTIAFLLLAGALITSGPSNFGLRAIWALLIAVVVTAVVWSLFEIPCLNCLKPMGRVGFWVANGRMVETSPRCPHCDISVDEKIPRPPRN